jgi:hypothetical protein
MALSIISHEWTYGSHYMGNVWPRANHGIHQAFDCTLIWKMYHLSLLLILGLHFEPYVLFHINLLKPFRNQPQYKDKQNRIISPHTHKHPHIWTMHQFDLQSLLLFQYAKHVTMIEIQQAILPKLQLACQRRECFYL